MGLVAAFRKVSADQLEKLRVASDEQWEQFEIEHADDCIDVDKSWDGLDFVLTGKCSGQPVQLGKLFGNFMRNLMGQTQKKEPTPPAPPCLDWVMREGESFGGERFELDHPSYISAQRVKEIASELEKVSEDDLQTRFDAPAMIEAGVYLGEFWARDRDEALSYLTENFRILKSFFAAAAAEDMVVIRYFC